MPSDTEPDYLEGLTFEVTHSPGPIPHVGGDAELRAATSTDPPQALPGAMEERKEAGEEAGKEQEPKRKGGKLKGGFDAAEAGRLRWAKERERTQAESDALAAATSGKVVLVRTPIQVGDILARLNTEAKKGNVQAARELREWMREFPAEDETDLSALDARTRQQVVARLLAEIAADEGDHPLGVSE